jgi:plastocyanin
MPGPSIRPFLGALGAAVLFGGLVIGGWVLVAAVIFFAWTLLGWLTDFKAEYRKVVEADRTGHLENIPARTFPKRTLLVAGIALALVTAGQLGFLTPATAGDGEGSPPPDGGGPSAPPGAQTVVARGIAFDIKALDVAAGEAFTIFMINEDPPNTPHDIDIRSQDGATLQNQREIPGGESVAYEYEPLDSGEYVFICSIHPIPAMTGTVTVQ